MPRKRSSGTRLLLAGVIGASTIALVVPALGAGPKTKLVSKTSAGAPANDDTGVPSMSASGRYVAFESEADNLPGDDAEFNICVHDRKTGKTRLISKTSSGAPADGGSFNPSTSASGRYIAFESEADNLPGDDAVYDIYVHDRETGKTELVSKTSSGAAADDSSGDASISASGRYVAFISDADNLPGDDAVQDVYVHDRKTGKTKLISKTSSGTAADDDSAEASISASGRYTAFESEADNLPGDDSVPRDVYVHDRKTGKTKLISKTSSGAPADARSANPSISASGRHVAFASDAANLPGDDLFEDVYVHDRKTGKTKLVSKTSSGDLTDDHSFDASISASGRYVAFVSDADNLPGDDAYLDIYVHDRKTRKTKLVSKTSSGASSDEDSYAPSISGSGAYVAFQSRADNLPGTDGVTDVFTRGPLG